MKKMTWGILALLLAAGPVAALEGRARPFATCADRLGRPIRGVPWSTVNFKELFQTLTDAGVPLGSSEIKRKYSDKVRAVLKKKYAYKIQGAGLVDAVKKQYGSWDAALSANGFDPIDYRSRYDNTSRDQILRGIRALHRAGVAINAGSIGKDHSRSSKEILWQELKIVISAEALYFRALKEFKKWSEAVRIAGLPVTDLIQETQVGDWSGAFIIEVIQTLAARYPDMNAIALQAHNDEIRQLTYEKFRRIVMPATLAINAAKVYGSWLNALKTANVDTQNIRWMSRVEWTPKKVIKVIQFLSKRFSPLRIEVLRLQNQRVAEMTSGEFHETIGAIALFSAARKYYGTWPGALDAAGVDTSQVSSQLRGMKWSDDLIKDVLFYLSKQRVNFTLENFLTNPKVRKLTLDHYRLQMGPSVIYNAAVAAFGGWREALAAADVPLKFEKRDRVTSDIVIMPHTVTWEQMPDGRSRKVVEYGAPSATPEEALIAADEESNVRSAIGSLSSSENGLAQAVLEYLEDHDSLEDKDAVIAFVNSQTGEAWTWENIQQVLMSLGKELRDDE